MLLENHLHLARIDVVAARDDELFDAATDGERSILGDLANVASAKPTVGEGVGRRGGVPPVAFEDLPALQLDFILIAQAHLDSRQGETHAAWLARPIVGVGDHDSAFRDAIAFQDWLSEDS